MPHLYLGDSRWRQGRGFRRFRHSEMLPGRRSWADWFATRSRVNQAEKRRARTATT